MQHAPIRGGQHRSAQDTYDAAHALLVAAMALGTVALVAALAALGGGS